MNRSLFRFNSLLRRSTALGLAIVAASMSWAVDSVSTLAGSSAGFNNATGTAAKFEFSNPSSAVVDGSGNIYVADAVNNVIRMITPAGVVTTFAGTGLAGLADGTGTTSVRFSSPRGLAIDGVGNLYVADTGNNAIRQITSAGVVTTITSTGGFSAPRGIAANRAGTNGAATKLFVADSGNNVIRQIDLSGPSVTLIAGTASSSGGYANDGSGVNVLFQNPVGILSDSAGNTLYVADEQNHAIRAVTVSTGATTTLAGAGPSDSGAAADTEGTGTSARFRNPIGLAFDTSGNILVTDRLSNTVRRVTTGGVTSLVAGTALSAGSTDGLALSVARFNTPSGIAANSTAIYVVDTNNQRIRMITSGNAPAIGTQPTNQTVTAGNTATFTVGSVSGTPTPSLQWQISTDSGSNWSNLSNTTIGGGTISGATTSQLSIVTSGTTLTGALFRLVATNGVGTGALSNSVSLTVNAVSSGTSPSFVSVSSTTFAVNQSGTFTVQASGDPAPTYGYTGDFPTWANLNTSTGVVSGTPPDATVSSYSFTITATNTAGSASQSFTLLVSATLLSPQISTQPTSRTVALGQSATFTVIASGNPTPSYQWQRFRSGDSGFVALAEGGSYSGTSSATLTVSSVTSAMSGDQFQVVVSNSNGTSTSSAVQLTVTLGTVWSTVAGQAGISGYADGTGGAAKFLGPNAIALDSAGNAYVADAGNHVIRKVTADGVVTTYVGVPNSPGNADTDTVNGVAGKLNSPSAVALDAQGNLYVADSGNHAIRKVTGGFITTVAGQPGTLGFADGLGTAARFAFPSGIAIDSSGNIYVADSFNQVIRRIVGGNVQTIAGTQGIAGQVDASGTSAKFNFPTGLTVDSAFNVYVVDSRNHAIRKITSNGVVSTYAGSMGLSGSTDATGTAARFNQPQGVAVDSSGVLYVADTFNHTIRRISTAAEVTTIGGVALSTGSADGAANTARFNQPYGIAVDASGNLWVADTVNHTIRRSGALTAPSVTTQPTAQTSAVGGSVTFTVAASGVPAPGFQWQRKANGASDFVNLSDSGSYSGTSTATLTVANITSDMSGDEFRAIAANLVLPNAESSSASLTVVAPPVITSANNATFRVGDAGSFTVTATSDRTVTYSAVGLPTGISINSSSGVISGTPVSTSGSPFTVIITANNGTSSSSATTQTFTLTVEPAQVPPTITTQPVAVTVNRGDTVTLTAAASGTAPLTYQWLKNGGAVNGATTTTLTIPNAQESTAGFYALKATNPFGSATSAAALVSVNTLPVLLTQPRAQTVLQGSSVTFSASASGSSATTYQWRKNGVAIAGANSSTYSISSVAAGDAGNYDVVITNPLGQVTSSVAQLTVVTTAAAPVFTQQPASATVLAGSTLTLSAAASAAPAATYQWRKDGVAINGATNSTLTLSSVSAGDAGNYSVVASNSAGSATSDSGALRVIARSFAGTYFGSFGSNLGTFAIFIRDDNTGVFLGYLPGSTAPVVSFDIGVNDAGQFSFSQTAIASSGNEGEPARAAALNAVTVNGTIGSDGAISGSISGGASATLSATRSASTGTSQSYAGYYQSAAGSSAAVTYTIVGANGTAFALAQSGAAADGGTGTVNNLGQVSVSTGRTTINETIIAGPGAITTQLSGALSGTLAGAAESVLRSQRLANISSRARVVGATSKAIAGFVITGNESKPVLIRAVGPTLNSAFGITSALTTPVLELYRGASVIASNTGVASLSAAARDAITAAGTQAGAFALGSSGGDSAIFTTLAPGNYTAQVSGGGNSVGIVLVEVYDLSSATTGQKLLNISTLANTGSGLDTLTAGVVVTGSVPKRVLIRAVGPGLAQLGVTGYLTNPTLQLIQGTQTITQNTDWNNSSDKAAIAAAAPTVGAFPLVTGDSAMIVSLNPGNYTAQVVSTTGGTGIAIVEIYELP